MTQTIEYQGYQPLKKKKMSYQQNTIAAFRQSYGAGGKIFSIWVKPRKTRKNSNLQDNEANSWHKSQTRSYSINPFIH